MPEHEDKKPVFKATNMFVQADAAAKKWNELGITEEPITFNVTPETTTESIGEELKARGLSPTAQFLQDRVAGDFVKDTITTKIEIPMRSETFAAMEEMFRKAYGERTLEQERLLHRVLVFGTMPAAHIRPKPLDCYGSRVQQSRHRKLYSARLRRDRRAKRQGRKPVLRTTNLLTRIPRAEVRQGPGFNEMQIIASPYVEQGTALVFDTQLMADALRNVGRGFALTAERARDVAQSIRGMRPTGFWVDEVTKINPEA